MKLMVFWWVVLAIYAVVNGLAVFLPFIPGPPIFFFWGFLAPLIMVIVWWGFLTRRKKEMANWWVMGILSTFAYFCLGAGSVWVVGQIWAAV